MNRKLKWTLVLLASSIFVLLSIIPLWTATQIFYINRYIRVGSTLLAYARMLQFQAGTFISLAVLIPLTVWWKEDN